MKFGGSSLAAAERILAVAEIVRARLARRPVVVASALAGVTDLLERAACFAERDEPDELEPVLADLERRHRWAIAGSIEDPRRRHQLNLEIDGLFEELRQHLRSIRVLGERTARSADALLAFGELLSTRILVAVFIERRLPAHWVDPRQVMLTGDGFGAAEPDIERVSERCSSLLLPVIDEGKLPVIGGFVGATASGDTTTLGRGGSDTSAAVLGLALRAEEIQIWTDVDGLMTADPKLVPTARRLERVSFAEAAELAFYGAKVLHPDAIAPAVSQKIPVWVLNSLRPEGPGTLVLDDTGGRPGLAAVASRGGVHLVRLRARRMSADPRFLPRVLEACAQLSLAPDLLVSSEVGVTLATGEGTDPARLGPVLEQEAECEVLEQRAIICVVGAALAGQGRWRERVLSALSAWRPELVALGASGTSAAAVLEGSQLVPAVRELHRCFFEAGEPDD